MLIYLAGGLTARSQARDLLATAVREVRGLDALPEISRHEGGKPFFPACPDLHFNLSHSGSFALCALDAAPVGVDIQIVRAWRAALPRRVCSPGELRWLEAQPDLWPAFTQLWALKECRAKQSGRGLTSPIRDIPVPLPRPGLLRMDGLYFRVWSAPQWAAAACGSSEPPETFRTGTLCIP